MLRFPANEPPPIQNDEIQTTDPKSLKWYFLYDEHPGHKIDTNMVFPLEKPYDPATVLVRGYVEFMVNARYLACYVPEHPLAERIAASLIRDIQNLLALFDGMSITYSHNSGTDPARHLSDTQFTRRLILYLENRITPEERKNLNDYGRQTGLFVYIRDKSYAEMRNGLESQ